MSTLELVHAAAADKPILLSNSQRSSWLRCPNQFRLERAGYPVAPSMALIAGSAFHAGCDVIDWNLWEQSGDLTGHDLEGIWNDCLKVELKEAYEKEPDTSKWRVFGRKTADKPNKEDLAWWTQAGVGMLAAYLVHRKREIDVGYDIWELPDGSPAIEVSFQFEIVPGVILRGAIDRIMRDAAEQFIIRDLKTSQREPEDKSQLGIYRVAVQDTFGETPNWGDYYMARKGESTNPAQLTHFDRELLAREYGYIALARRLNIYPANPGDSCRSCGVRKACAAVGGAEADTWLNLLP